MITHNVLIASCLTWNLIWVSAWMVTKTSPVLLPFCIFQHIWMCKIVCVCAPKRPIGVFKKSGFVFSYVANMWRRETNINQPTEMHYVWCTERKWSIECPLTDLRLRSTILKQNLRIISGGCFNLAYFQPIGLILLHTIRRRWKALVSNFWFSFAHFRWFVLFIHWRTIHSMGEWSYLMVYNICQLINLTATN